jgi:hypothetical protein
LAESDDSAGQRVLDLHIHGRRFRSAVHPADELPIDHADPRVDCGLDDACEGDPRLLTGLVASDAACHAANAAKAVNPAAATVPAADRAAMRSLSLRNTTNNAIKASAAPMRASQVRVRCIGATYTG